MTDLFCNFLEKSNMLILSKEMNKKDHSLKTPITSDLEKNEKNENVWSENGFFEYQEGDFNISKKHFPENILIYTNQATISIII